MKLPLIILELSDIYFNFFLKEENHEDKENWQELGLKENWQARVRT